MEEIESKPISSIGKWSIGLIILTVILSILSKLLEEGLLFDDGLYVGIAAFFCGIIAIARKKDYSGWVILSTVIGFIFFSIKIFFLVEHFSPGFWYGS